MIRTLTLLATTALLAGCAAMNSLTSDVASYSAMAGRSQARHYAFERLPSQQLRADRAQLIEDSARRALEARATPGGRRPVRAIRRAAGRARQRHRGLLRRSVLVARRPVRAPLRTAVAVLRFRRGMPTVTYEREVALLIRDRKSGQPLYKRAPATTAAHPAWPRCCRRCSRRR